MFEIVSVASESSAISRLRGIPPKVMKNMKTGM